jgi:hypothetical protein
MSFTEVASAEILGVLDSIDDWKDTNEDDSQQELPLPRTKREQLFQLLEYPSSSRLVILP